jgi:hypothetical protein
VQHAAGGGGVGGTGAGTSTHPYGTSSGLGNMS